MPTSSRVLAVALGATCSLSSVVQALAVAPAPPALLSQTGLYQDPGAHEIAPGVRAFSPQYPLWTDGAAKSRWILLPQGARIDATDVDAWRFPVGTRLWKELAFGGRRVETRLSWHAAPDTWVFAAYAWSDDQSDATLVPEDGLPRAVEIAPGKSHSIPSVGDCSACHGASRSPVLGFNALQLSDDRDALAPHADALRTDMVTLRTLVEEALLSPPRPELVATPPRIAAATPRERAVLGYLAGNCGHCHASEGPLAHVGLVLAQDLDEAPAAARATIVDAPSRYLVPGAPEGATRRVAPGEPSWSAVLHRMRSRRPSSQMPPLGTVLPDADAIALVEAWIEQDLAPRPGRESARRE